MLARNLKLCIVLINDIVDYLGEIDVVNFLIVNSKRSSW